MGRFSGREWADPMATTGQVGDRLRQIPMSVVTRTSTAAGLKRQSAHTLLAVSFPEEGQDALRSIGAGAGMPVVLEVKKPGGAPGYVTSWSIPAAVRSSSKATAKRRTPGMNVIVANHNPVIRRGSQAGVAPSWISAAVGRCGVEADRQPR